MEGFPLKASSPVAGGAETHTVLATFVQWQTGFHEGDGTVDVVSFRVRIICWIDINGRWCRLDGTVHSHSQRCNCDDHDGGHRVKIMILKMSTFIDSSCNTRIRKCIIWMNNNKRYNTYCWRNGGLCWGQSQCGELGKTATSNGPEMNQRFPSTTGTAPASDPADLQRSISDWAKTRDCPYDTHLHERRD